MVVTCSQGSAAEDQRFESRWHLHSSANFEIGIDATSSRLASLHDSRKLGWAHYTRKPSPSIPSRGRSFILPHERLSATRRSSKETDASVAQKVLNKMAVTQRARYEVDTGAEENRKTKQTC